MRSHWTAQFEGHARRILDELKREDVVDFVQAFALPFSAECLKSITGLTNMRFEDMNAWSQGMIDGIANYVGDPAIEARCHAATGCLSRCEVRRREVRRCEARRRAAGGANGAAAWCASGSTCARRDGRRA